MRPASRINPLRTTRMTRRSLLERETVMMRTIKRWCIRCRSWMTRTMRMRSKTRTRRAMRTSRKRMTESR